ncbi:hypothetical protein C0993_007716 [Termitomyces sp. T159_Od127]|nr:hypothetical protein C0993_007716 [Termitomyces sp. T159_Od127]
MQVQLTQASFTHYMTKFSTLHQITDHISQSLQALLECLPPITAPPPVAEPSLAAPAVPPVALAAPAGPQAQIPHPALLDMYDSNHTFGEHFLQSCFTYIHFSRAAFDFDALKIAWMLSYMKAEWASTYALHVLQCPRGVGSFTDWAAFEKNFQAEFFSIDPAKSTAPVLHNKKQYRQGKWTLDKYIDSFQALVKQAVYLDSLQLCFTFQDGLHPALMELIDNLAKGCPDNEWIAFWYKHPASLHSVPAPALAAPTSQPLPLGIPMNIDATQQHHPASLLCRQCKKPEHFTWHCLLGLEVPYFSIVEQEELLLQLLAVKDAARAPSPDKPAPELALEESGACTLLPSLEEDF